MERQDFRRSKNKNSGPELQLKNSFTQSNLKKATGWKLRFQRSNFARVTERDLVKQSDPQSRNFEQRKVFEKKWMKRSNYRREILRVATRTDRKHKSCNTVSYLLRKINEEL